MTLTKSTLLAAFAGSTLLAGAAFADSHAKLAVLDVLVRQVEVATLTTSARMISVYPSSSGFNLLSFVHSFLLFI